MINYSIVHGGVDQDGNEIPPRFASSNNKRNVISLQKLFR